METLYFKCYHGQIMEKVPQQSKQQEGVRWEQEMPGQAPDHRTNARAPEL